MPFHFPKTYESKPFYGDNQKIASATLTYTGTIDQVKFWLGVSDFYDGTYIYEEVTPSVLHTFTASGKWLKWRALGSNGALTKIQVVVNT